MEYEELAQQIIRLKKDDLTMRDQLIQSGQLSNGYNTDMEHLHNKHANILDEIINKIGYPTIAKVGEEAHEAAWLVIQHAISQPAFMKKCEKLLSNAVDERQANPKHLAYLSDRIAAFEERPQLYGTGFDWDEQRMMSPKPFDDLNKVNQRRKELGLNTLEEQTHIIRKQAEEENEAPPKDMEVRKQQYDQWRKKVGWIS